MTNSVKTRLLTPDNWQMWRSLRLEALQSSPETLASSYEEEINYTEDEWRDKLQKRNIYGIFADNKLIAGAGFYRLNRIKTMHRGDLFGMYVAPEYRRKGIGGQLIEAIIEHAKSCVIQLHLSCIKTNDSALKLYQKYGFRIYGTETRSLKIGGIFFDEYLMLLELDK